MHRHLIGPSQGGIALEDSDADRRHNHGATQRVSSLRQANARTHPVVGVHRGGFLTLDTGIMITWIVRGQADRTPSGPDAVPAWMAWAPHTQEVVFTVAALFMIYRFIIKPRRKEGRRHLRRNA